MNKKSERATKYKGYEIKKISKVYGYSIRENGTTVATAKTIKEAKNKIDKIKTKGYC